jgi:hypothetical protein
MSSSKMFLTAGEFDDLFPTLRYLKEATEIVIAATEAERTKLAGKLAQMPAVATVSFETPEAGEARYKIQEFLRPLIQNWLWWKSQKPAAVPEWAQKTCKSCRADAVFGGHFCTDCRAEIKEDAVGFAELHAICPVCADGTDTRGVCCSDCLGIDADQQAAYEAACESECVGYWGERHGKTRW